MKLTLEKLIEMHERQGIAFECADRKIVNCFKEKSRCFARTNDFINK